MIEKNGKSINSVEDWRQLAGPKEKIHWKDHRSAKESAKAWFRDGKAKLPSEIETIIEKSENFDLITIEMVEPEALLHFDEFSGPSNMDVLVKGNDRHGNFIIGIEAKADESFSLFVKDIFSDAMETKIETPNTKKIIRIEQLAQSFFSKRNQNGKKIGELRYQLLTGLAGTIAYANRNNINRAVFLIHEFNTPRTVTENHKQNQIDLNNFINRLTNGEIKYFDVDILYGPLKIPGKPLFDKIPDIYIGKVRKSLM
jgi:hypothetical protein